LVQRPQVLVLTQVLKWIKGRQVLQPQWLKQQDLIQQLQ